MSSTAREHAYATHNFATDLHGFAAGLGHELSNIVAALKIRIDCLSQDPGLQGGSADLDAMRTALDRARRLTHGLRMLASDPAGSELDEATSLEDWLLAVGPLLRAMAPRGLSIQTALSGQGTYAMAAPAALTRIAFTLVEAVCTAPQSPPVGQITVRLRSEGPGVELSVSQDRDAADWTTRAGKLRQSELCAQIGRLGGKTTFDCHPTTVRITVMLGTDAPRPAARTATCVFVDVAHPRTRAVVLSELHALGCDTTSDPKQRATCELEVVDAMRSPPRHPWKVVLLADSAHTAGESSVLPIGQDPKVGAVREALRKLLQASD